MEFTFSVLTAVSKEDQATEDKNSLDFQLQRAKDFGERMGGAFTREYRADGFSRSGWWDLTPALQQCEAFNELARDAQLHLFDVVIVESYDRLGDLGIFFFNFFAGHGPPYIQIISVQQKIMIEEPLLYHPRRDDSIPSAIAESLKVNKYRTNKVFRAFEVGNPARARAGKYSIHYGYGYVLVNKDTDELAIDETVAGLLIQFKDKFLAGESLPKIAEFGNASGIRSPKGSIWRTNSITYILRNPFYSGKTFHGRGYINELGTYTTRTDAELFDGKHEPLWSYDAYLKILAEYERRNSLHSVPKDYNFTGLLKCGVCGLVLRTLYGSSSAGHRFRYWWCRGHVSIRHDRANDLVADAVIELYENHSLPKVTKEKTQSRVLRELAEVERKLVKLEQAYNADAYTVTEYATRRNDLKKRQEALKDTQRQEAEDIRAQADRVRDIETFKQFLPDIRDFIHNDPPEQVKFQLSKTVTLIAHPDKSITAEFKSNPQT